MVDSWIMIRNFLQILLRKAIFGITFTSFLLGASMTAHADNPSIVVDVASGKVLHSTRATDPWYPASITKLMTVYVALQEVKAGRAKLDQLLTMSATAAKLPPSKMGFKAGSKVRLDNALIIIMVKSANDVAAMIAENLGGSEAGFALKMNATARRIGMQESNFVNAHGLPDTRQVVSARDMAVLSRALMLEFPEYQGLFQIGAIRFGKRVMPNHNGLIGRYPGANGMKTGFICSSGFNLVGAATQNGRQLITVVLGAPSAKERNNEAAELLDRGFSSTGLFTVGLDSWPSNAGTQPPDLRAEICKRNTIPMDDANTSASLTMKDPGNPLATLQVQAFAPPPPPEDHASLAPKAAAYEPIVVWVGLNAPKTKTAGGTKSASQTRAELEDYAPLPPVRPRHLSFSVLAQDMEPVQLR